MESEQRPWWILILAKSFDYEQKTKLSVRVRNLGTRDLILRYTTNRFEPVVNGASIVIFEGSLSDFVRHSSGLGGLACDSKMGDVDMMLDFVFNNGGDLSQPLHVVAHTQALLP